MSAWRPANERMLVCALLATGFLLRLAWALCVDVAPVSDSEMYDAFARSIAAGEGYVLPDGSPTAFWAVGPSAFYGFLYFLFGPTAVVVVTANLFLGTLLIWLVYLVARREFGALPGLVAGGMIAFWPLLIQFTTVIASELPFMVLVVAAFAAWRWPRPPYWLQTVLFAVLLGCAVYVRPTALPLLVLLPLARGVLERRPMRGVAGALIALAVGATMLAPWAQRNATAFEHPVLVSSNFGVNLWMGNNPASTGGYMPLPPDLPADETARDAHLKERAIAYIRENPQDYLRLAGTRAIATFGRETIGVAWNQVALDRILAPPAQTALKAVSSGYWLVGLFGSLAGVVLFLRAGPVRLLDPLLITFGLFALVPVLTVGQDRYHMPIIPFVAIFGALFFCRAFARFRAASPAQAHGVPASG